MKLTDKEIEYTRQVAAEIGRDPDDLIREGEQLKDEGYHRAELQRHQADEAIMGRASGAGMQAYGMSPGERLATIDPGAQREMEAGG